MARANRYYVPGHVWHITHRCHQQEFLLKFARDRQRWIDWLFDAKKRMGLVVLNYIVTSNHIHLLVEDTGNNVVAKSMQLIAGRVGQEYNNRKNRKGAFWEDRYHATAIDTESYLMQCMVYIDLNIVRAGVVKHPSEWNHSGYHELQIPPERYRILHLERLCELTSVKSQEEFTLLHFNCVEEALFKNHLSQDEKWSKSLAVGSQQFTESYVDGLGTNGHYKRTENNDGCCVVKEPEMNY